MQRRSPPRTALLRSRSGAVADSHAISYREGRRRGFVGFFDDASTRAELIAVGWEFFSAMLFVSAVVPAAFDTGLVELIFVGSMVLSAAVARPLLASACAGYAWAGALRALAWPLSVAPARRRRGAAGLRRRPRLRPDGRRDAPRPLPPFSTAARRPLAREARAKPARAPRRVGDDGGHRRRARDAALQRRVPPHPEPLNSRDLVLDRARPRALGDPGLHARRAPGDGHHARRSTRSAPGPIPGSSRAGSPRRRRCPSTLAYLNFAVWFACTAFGVFYARPGPAAWNGRRRRAAARLRGRSSRGASPSTSAPSTATPWRPPSAAPALGRRDAPPAAEPLPLGARACSATSACRSSSRAVALAALVDRPLPRARRPSSRARELQRRHGARRRVRRAGRSRSAASSRGPRAISRGRWPSSRRPPTGWPAASSRPPCRASRARSRSWRSARASSGCASASPAPSPSSRRSAPASRRTSRRAPPSSRRALAELKRTQAALVQGERLASIGELVAGVAHEINNPLNAIAGAARAARGAASPSCARCSTPTASPRPTSRPRAGAASRRCARGSTSTPRSTTSPASPP